MNMQESFIRLKNVEDRTGLKKSMVYDLMSRGEFPKSIKIGERAVAWVESEVDAINAARMAEKSADEIRELVKSLMAKRQQMANEILAAA